MENESSQNVPYIIKLNNVTKVFGQTTVLEKTNLKIKQGEFVTILGPSGCGKSTTLRLIAGFETPTSGDIFLSGRDITSIPPYKRPVNTIFQHYALFPNLDVYDNVAFGLRNKKIPIPFLDKDGRQVEKVDREEINYIKSQIKRIKHDKLLTKAEKKERLSYLYHQLNESLQKKVPCFKYRKLTAKEIDDKVIKALTIVDMEELEGRDISTLSGGQQQRVAIARAIVCEPKILLLDEPLGALDLKMRKDMQLELIEMHKRLGITFIYVTHDQEEALTMSDTIIVMNNGEIQQIGTPEDIYNEPSNAFVADFIGSSNIYNGTMVDEKRVRFLDTNWECVDTFNKNEAVDVVVRPEDIHFSLEPKTGYIEGKIAQKVFKGIHYQYIIMVGREEVLAQSIKDFDPSKPIYIQIRSNEIHLMKRENDINSYSDSYIGRDYCVYIDEYPFECELNKLIPGSKLDDSNHVLYEGKKYDFRDADVVASIKSKDFIISDITEDANIVGDVVNSVWKGDHYLVLVKSKDEEYFFVATPYSFNPSDIVGLKVNKENISLKLKGEIEDYEV